MIIFSRSPKISKAARIQFTPFHPFVLARHFSLAKIGPKTYKSPLQWIDFFKTHIGWFEKWLFFPGPPNITEAARIQFTPFHQFVFARHCLPANMSPKSIYYHWNKSIFFTTHIGWFEKWLFFPGPPDISEAARIQFTPFHPFVLARHFSPAEIGPKTYILPL